ncbi:MAG: carboxypeptidase regulatory-like domain-containing protein [Fusobacteriaceae bacterium]
MLKKIKKIIFYSSFFIFYISSLLASTSKVQGNLKFKNTNIGAVEINFIDSENNSNRTTTDIYGDFSIFLPSKTYKIKIDKVGYILDKKDDIIYDFSNEKSIKLSLQLNEVPSFISGQVKDNIGTPISNAQINIQGSNENITLHSDKMGYFKSYINSGTFYLTTQSQGYDTNTLVKNIENFSSITNLDIKLNRQKFDISGIISDGSQALNNISIFLMDSKNKILSVTKSSENGFYEFLNIPSHFNVFIKVEDNSYLTYFSDPIKLHESIKNNYIIINK